jgi:hypothetical protein
MINHLYASNDLKVVATWNFKWRFSDRLLMNVCQKTCKAHKMSVSFLTEFFTYAEATWTDSLLKDSTPSSSYTLKLVYYTLCALL